MNVMALEANNRPSSGLLMDLYHVDEIEQKRRVGLIRILTTCRVGSIDDLDRLCHNTVPLDNGEHLPVEELEKGALIFFDLIEATEEWNKYEQSITKRAEAHNGP